MEISKESFKRWLARQPDEREFNYLDNSNCMFCAFAREKLGCKDVIAGVNDIYDGDLSHLAKIPPEFARPACRLADASGAHFTIGQFKAELAKQLHRESL